MGWARRHTMEHGLQREEELHTVSELHGPPTHWVSPQPTNWRDLSRLLSSHSSHVLVYVHTCTNLHTQDGQPKQQGLLGGDAAIDLEETNSHRATAPTQPPAMVPGSQVWEAGREASQNREHILFFILPLRSWGLLIK